MRLKNLQEFFELRKSCPFCRSSLKLCSPIGLTFKQNQDILSIYYDNSLSVFCTTISTYYNFIGVNTMTNKVIFNRRDDVFPYLEEDRVHVLKTNRISLEMECANCIYRGIAMISMYSEEMDIIRPHLREDQFVLNGYPVYMNYENNRTYIYGGKGSLRKTFDGIIFDLEDVNSIEERLETLELFG